MGQHPDRNAQFENIGRLRQEYQQAGDPVISIDTKKKELLGTAFTGRVYDGGFPGPGGIGPPNFALMRKLSFGRYTNQLTTLSRYKGVQDELKLTADQLKKLADALVEFREKFQNQPLPVQDEEKAKKVYEERSAFIEKKLGEILTKEQQARFAPKERRLEQIDRAERLLGEIEPEKRYPYEYLVFRITGFRPERAPDLGTSLRNR